MILDYKYANLNISEGTKSNFIQLGLFHIQLVKF